MNVLGIETSCDETSAAVVKDGRRVFSNETASSLKFHKIYGGIVPEIASRMQLETISQVTDKALKDARVTLRNIDLVSVTSGPGLLGSLLVGISFAKSISISKDIPLIGINHVHSHFYANFLDGKGVKLPFVALVVSGGHTSLYFVKDFDDIELLGQTQDDACGEAFDKVAKILGLGYPGGPFIEKAALKADSRKYKFSCSNTKMPLDFSFSGIKTAVLYAARNRKVASQEKFNICASFQEAVFDVLIKKSKAACRRMNVDRIVIGGGVAVNNRLREKFREAQMDGLKCYFPPRQLCMDNAAMIAGFGYQLFKRGKSSGLDLTAELN